MGRIEQSLHHPAGLSLGSPCSLPADAWQGDVQSSILNRAQQQDAFIWRTTDEILKLLPLTDGAVVINIHKIMNTIQR